MIARCLDVELHSLVPFLIDGFVFAMPGSGAHESHCVPSCFRGKMTYPRRKRFDRYGLRLEQVQRVVAICVEAGIGQNVKTKMSQHFFPSQDRGVTGRFFAAIGGVQFPLFLRGLFLHKKNWIRSSFSCFYRGMKRS